MDSQPFTVEVEVTQSPVRHLYRHVAPALVNIAPEHADFIKARLRG